MTTDMDRAPAAVRETHSGIVVLSGAHAYKVKKPVNLAFLDFRSEQARRAACRREIDLNRRLAPDVYEDLAEFAPHAAHVSEPVIVMRRMPEELRLSTLVTAGADVEDHLRAVARLLAAFHARADRSARIAAEGGADRLHARWTANLHESRPFCPDLLEPHVHAAVGRLALAYVDGRGPLFEARMRAGLVVDGHGDLIAEDIFCLPDYPRVLDCLEFDDRLRWVDVLDDIAFLAMDLERLGRPDLAQLFLDRYEEFAAAVSVASLRHHYVAYRAFVRAKVACLRSGQGDPDAAAEATADARIALAHLRAGEVRLVLVGGAPGTGKSTVAAALADRRGWVLLGSDTVRRETCTGRERYAPAARDGVYAELLTRTRRLLGHGESVVLDATWGEVAWRRLAAATAEETHSKLVMLECVAPVELAASRAQRRRDAGGSPSEADGQVARALAAARAPWPGAVRIDTAAAVDAAVAAALRASGPG